MNLVLSTYLAFLAFVCFTALIKTSACKKVTIVSWEIFMLNSSAFEIQLMLDFISATFLFTVAVISAATLLFSKTYMQAETHFSRFHLLVVLFIISMKLLILSTSLIALLLGWDMLGVTSFLLVVYYNNSKGLNAGMLTLMSNRVGDSLLLMAIATSCPLFTMNLFTTFSMETETKITIFLITLAATTKSAQIPFSAWLPAAMAAPTPVSTLVHSSTLVTAGVYLLLRLGPSFTDVMKSYILVMGSLTALMASVTALFEMDMKKIVALSTLSQLGLMMASIGMGLYLIAFFHLIVHAFFKALLFITVGNMIHSSSEFQDLRKGNISSEKSLITNIAMISSNLSLMGIPFFSSFYSKDMIVEMNMTSLTNSAILTLFLMSLMLTVLYSLRFLSMTMISFNKNMSTNWKEDTSSLTNASILMLWPLSVVSGSLFAQILLPDTSTVILSWELKFSVLGMLLLGGLKALTADNQKHSMKSALYWSHGIMWAMPQFSSQTPILMANFSGAFFSLSDYTLVQYLSFASTSMIMKMQFYSWELSYALKFKKILSILGAVLLMSLL